MVREFADAQFYGKIMKVKNGIFFIDDENKCKYSTDFGQTFNYIPTNDSINNPYPSLVSFSVDNEKLVYSFSHVVGGSGILYNYASFDGMNSFFQLGTGKSEVVLLDSTILALDLSVVPKALKISHNLGQSWDTLPEFPPHLNSSNSFFLSKLETKIYIKKSTYSPNTQTAYVSDNHGQTWNLTSSTNTFTNPVYISNNLKLALHANRPDNIALLNSNNEIMGSRMEGILSGTFTGVRTNNGKIYAYSKYNVFKSDNDGVSWSQILGFSSSNTVAFFNVNNDTLFAMTNGLNKLFRSANGGLTWDSLILPIEVSNGGSNGLGLLVNGTEYIFTNGDYSGSWISNDFGVSWVQFPVPFVQPNGYYLFKFGNTIFSAFNNGKLMRLNINSQWDSLLTVYSPGTTFPQIYQVDNKLLFSGNSFINSYISLDTGTTWNTFNTLGLPSGRPNNIIAYNNFWYAIFSGYGIYASNNQGLNWSLLSTGFPVHSDLDTLHGSLYATSIGNGLWSFSGAQLTAVSGKVFYDLNNNGQIDILEPPFSNANIKLINQNTTTHTNLSGDYSFFSISATDSILCTVNGTLASPIPQIQHFNGNNQLLDFALQFDSNDYDASVFALTPIAVPSYNFTLSLSVKNNALPISGGVLKILPHSNVSFSSNILSDSSTSFSGDTLFYQMGPLAFQQQIAYDFQFDSLVGFNIGDTLRFEIWFKTNEIDLLPSNNYRNVISFVVGSFDPNDKQCLTGAYFTPQQLLNDEEIEYQIRFENTGNYYAQMVRILDTLSTHLDPSSLRILSSSHPTNFTINNQIINFYFPGICLPSIEQDSILNKGYVAFAIKCKSSTSQFDIVNNSADIYFDFNTPIHTNTVTTFIDYPPILVTSLLNDNSIQGFKVYPNPLSDYTFITSKGKSKIKSIMLYSLIGKEVWRQDFNSSLYQLQLLMSDFSSGVYFLTVLGEEGEKTIHKLVKNK